MLIIGIGFFVTTWISSRRTSNLYTDEEAGSKDVSDAASKTYTSQSRFSSPRKAKDAALKVEETKAAEETTANDSKGPSDTSENLSGTVDLNKNNLLPDSLTPQAESQNGVTSKAYESAVTYASLKEPFQQLYDLRAQTLSITDELTEQMNIAGGGGKIDRYEYGKKLDERDAIQRRILSISKEIQEIVPDAIEIRETLRYRQPPPASQTIINYLVFIWPEKLEASLGKMPQDIESFFPDIKGIHISIPEDENFSWTKIR